MYSDDIIVLSVDGLLHREAENFLKRIAANLAHKWEKPYSKTCGYISGLYYHKGNQFVSKGFTSEVEEWTWDG